MKSFKLFVPVFVLAALVISSTTVFADDTAMSEEEAMINAYLEMANQYTRESEVVEDLSAEEDEMINAMVQMANSYANSDGGADISGDDPLKAAESVLSTMADNGYMPTTVSPTASPSGVDLDGATSAFQDGAAALEAMKSGNLGDQLSGMMGLASLAGDVDRYLTPEIMQMIRNRDKEGLKRVGKEMVKSGQIDIDQVKSMARSVDLNMLDDVDPAILNHFGVSKAEVQQLKQKAQSYLQTH